MASPSPFIPPQHLSSAENSPQGGHPALGGASRWHPGAAAGLPPSPYHHAAAMYAPPPAGPYAPAYPPAGYPPSGMPGLAHAREPYADYAGYGAAPHRGHDPYGHLHDPRAYGEPPPLAQAPGGGYGHGGPPLPPPALYPAHGAGAYGVPGVAHGAGGAYGPAAYGPPPAAGGYGAYGYPAAQYPPPAGHHLPRGYGHGYEDEYEAPPPPRGMQGPLEGLDMHEMHFQPEFRRYFPVVSKEEVAIQQIRLQLHPYLRLRSQSQAPLPESEWGFIRWDMRYPTRSASFSTESTGRTWTRGRSANATWPPTTDLVIACPLIPWIVQVHDPQGITLGGLMETLDRELHRRVSSSEMPREKEQARAVAAAYHQNRDELRGVLMDGMIRVDFLGERCEFGGLVQDEKLLAERMNVRDYPVAFSLVCLPLGGVPAAHNAVPRGAPASGRPVAGAVIPPGGRAH